MKSSEVKQFFEESRVKILAFTGMSPEEYSTLVFERGIEFLELETGGDQWSIKAMSTMQIFWQWWKNIWYSRDMHWVFGIETGIMKKGLASYLDFQSIESIDSYPTTLIYQQSYSNLIEKISKDGTKSERCNP